MYISQVHLKNIRGIGPEGLIADFATPAVRARGSLAGWNAIAGPNGAGKTTLLQGMAATLVGGAGSNWLLRPSDRKDWIHRSGAEAKLDDKGETSVFIEWVPGDDQIAPDEQRLEPVRLQVEWFRDGTSSRDVPPPGAHTFVFRHFWGASMFGAGKPDGWIFAGYGPHRANRQSSQDAADLSRSTPRVASVVTLFREDAGLEGINEWLIDLALNARDVDTDKALLLDGVLRLLGDRLLRHDERTELRVEADGLWVLWQNAWRAARTLGDGYRATLAMVADILMRIERFKPGRLLEEILSWTADDSSPLEISVSGVVVIDEPEIHLHPELQQRLGFWLKSHFPKIQFLVTTHSPLVCQATDAGGLFHMPSCGRIQPADDQTHAAVTHGTVDDAILSRLFGLESPQSEQATLDRRRLGELESKKIRAGLGEEDERERQDLQSKMPRDPSYQLDTLVQAFLRR